MPPDRLPPTASAAIVDKAWFQSFIAFVIVLNIFSIGLETDSACVDCGNENTTTWMIVNSMFATIYVVEFGLKFNHYGMRCLRTIPQILDAGFVLIAILDTWVLYFVMQNYSVRTLSMLLVLRVARLSRVLRFMTRQPELKLLLLSLMDIYKILIPMCTTLVFVVYFMALVIGSVYRRGYDDTAYPSYGRWSGSEYWGSLLGSMYTFFQLSTGDKWAQEIVRPLVRRYPLYVLIFVPYIGVMFFAFRAAMIGKICDHVIQSGNAAEGRIQTQEKRRKETIAKLKQIYSSLNKSPIMTYSDLSVFNQQESSRKLLTSLNIPVTDLIELFYILDIEDKESVSVDEFFASIIRLTGPAMGRHVTSIKMTSFSLVKRMTVATVRVAALDNAICEMEKQCCEVSKAYGLTSGATSLNLDQRDMITSTGQGGSRQQQPRNQALRDRFQQSRLARIRKSLSLIETPDD